jgi:hypothetical protein
MDGGFNPRVNLQNLSGNIPQLRNTQPPFIAGGNQDAYYLGLKGNNMTSTTIPNPISYRKKPLGVK